MGEKNYFVDLKGIQHCRIRVYVKTVLGKVVDLVVQLELWERSEWRAVVRYDCAHGHPHMDILSRSGEQEKKWLRDQDLNDILAGAIEDFRKNWERHLRRYGYEEN